MEGRHMHGHSHARHHLHSRMAPAGVDLSSQLTGRGIMDRARAIEAAAMPLMARKSEEKTGGPNMNIIIAVCVAVPVVLSLGVLFFLHRRSQKRQALEDADVKYRSMDFGLGDHVPGKGNKRRSAFFGNKEKEPGHKAQQLSMDMNLSSPYLLPPTLQHSHESLATISKSLHQRDDPYRMVSDYTSDVGSMRSFQRGGDRNSSIYNSKSRPSSTDRSSSRARSTGGPPRQNSLPQSPAPARTPQSKGSYDDAHPPLPAKAGFQFNDDAPSRPGPTTMPQSEDLPTIQEPPAAAQKSPQQAIVTDTARPMSNESSKAGQPYATALVNEPDSMPAPKSESHPVSDGLGIMDSAPVVPRPPRKESMPVIDTSGIQEYQQYAQNFQLDVADESQDGYEPRGRSMQQYPNEQDYPHSAGLGVPGQDNRRLSVGFRPLPPDEMLESEDPEFRANRIRSFYKEYFDDSVKLDAGRPPPMPQSATYYEDYDNGYMGEAAYFDPETNAFVMPYAEPVHRRAMTPPPNSRKQMPGPRMRGPPGPRGPGGPPGGRPRAGSTMSAGRWGPQSPRPGSSASQPRFGGKPRKPMPPPAALSTLPTPSKLKDDSFALMASIDFAPPPTFKDQASGRSQSPVGERVPYRVGTPVHSPLVSSYDETAALPSPHLLRKSGTFTGLDFAPPRRFKDPDSMSDAGSIRSNRSGMSSKAAFGVRSGAGRVSRLPGDTVFTSAALQGELKPQWGMRP